MPTLNWIGKDKVVGHHNDVPYHVLEHQYGYSAEKGQTTEPTHSGNMIIHGDNLLALKSLMPMYEGRIKCIYIDPPYNTGNENWVYNDNVNDPHIKKWLGEVVGKEGEDLSRHDKWLCMMYPRLVLMKKLLSEDGALIISIGFHEFISLITILKELFSTKQIVTITVQTSGGKPSGGFNYQHEYLIFVVDKEFKPLIIDFCGGTNRPPFEGMTLSTFNKAERPNQTYPIFINKKTGKFEGCGKSIKELQDEGYEQDYIDKYVYNYSTAPHDCVAIWPITSKGKECVWRLIPKRIKQDYELGYIKITPNIIKTSKNLYSIQYLPDGVINKINKGILSVISRDNINKTLELSDNSTEGKQIPTIWTEKAFYTVKGSSLLKEILPEAEKKFNYPKPIALIKSVIQIICNSEDIVLDSFAGSGTTGHAIIDLNKSLDYELNFILIEMMDYANNITAERMRRAISGYPFKGKKEEEIYSKKLTAKNILKAEEFLKEAESISIEKANEYTKISKPKIADNCLKVIGTKMYDDKMEGLGGAFDYYELGAPLFNEDGNLNEEVGIDKIREYIYYAETKQPLLLQQDKDEEFLLDECNRAGYYFYYQTDKATTLSYATLTNIVKSKHEMYIIYADRCLLDEKFMTEHHIKFKKIPRYIKRF
jgi:adenine-specific DNA-methyltransferase